MKATLAATSALLLGMAVLMLGAGLQATLLGVRATLEGFPTAVTGVVMAGYYLGYLGGSLAAPALVQRVGHIRVFAALTSVAAAAILTQAVFVSPWFWTLLRAVSGFCFAGIYVVAESWLNDRADNRTRGRLLSIYMVVIYLGLGLGQFQLNLADPRGPQLFILIAVLISLAVVPMALTAQRAPEFALPQRVSFRELFAVSPLGAVGVLVSGAVSGTLFSLGSVYAAASGFDAAGVAAFMACSILPAVIVQLPVGRWSDAWTGARCSLRCRCSPQSRPRARCCCPRSRPRGRCTRSLSPRAAGCRLRRIRYARRTSTIICGRSRWSRPAAP